LSLKKLVLAMLDMCKSAGDWDTLNSTILVISKRRSQSKAAITAMVGEATTYLDQTADRQEQLKLLQTLREVTDGRIYVEGERARLTKRLSDMKEEDGLVQEACDILQEVHVETYGALTRKEKAEFITEQIRLSLKTKDYVRALINSRKVNRKVLEEDGMDDIKLKYYMLMVEYYSREGDTWELCKCYHAIYRTPKVLAEEESWSAALSATVLFRALSKFNNETSDFLHRIQENERERLEQLVPFHELVVALTKDEIIGYPMEHQAIYESHSALKLSTDPAKLFHKRITQHNIRTVAKYYRSIRIQRLAQLLGLDVTKTERALAEMVEEGDLWARIDRPAGIVKFRPAEDLQPDQVLSEWNSDISKLLGLVQETTHLIQKENMLNKMQAEAA